MVFIFSIFLLLSSMINEGGGSGSRSRSLDSLSSSDFSIFFISTCELFISSDFIDILLSFFIILFNLLSVKFSSTNDSEFINFLSSFVSCFLLSFSSISDCSSSSSSSPVSDDLLDESLEFTLTFDANLSSSSIERLGFDLVVVVVDEEDDDDDDVVVDAADAAAAPLLPRAGLLEFPSIVLSEFFFLILLLLLLLEALFVSSSTGRGGRFPGFVGGPLFSRSSLRDSSALSLTVPSLVRRRRLLLVLLLSVTKKI